MEISLYAHVKSGTWWWGGCWPPVPIIGHFLAIGKCGDAMRWWLSFRIYTRTHRLTKTNKVTQQTGSQVYLCIYEFLFWPKTRSGERENERMEVENGEKEMRKFQETQGVAVQVTRAKIIINTAAECPFKPRLFHFKRVFRWDSLFGQRTQKTHKPQQHTLGTAKRMTPRVRNLILLLCLALGSCILYLDLTATRCEFKARQRLDGATLAYLLAGLTCCRRPFLWLSLGLRSRPESGSTRNNGLPEYWFRADAGSVFAHAQWDWQWKRVERRE